MKKIVIGALLFFLVSCAAEQLTKEQSSFRQTCLTNGDGWMKMSEMKDGKVVGPPCYGCMPDDNNHYCTLKDYNGGV